MVYLVLGTYFPVNAEIVGEEVLWNVANGIVEFRQVQMVQGMTFDVAPEELGLICGRCFLFRHHAVIFLGMDFCRHKMVVVVVHP